MNIYEEQRQKTYNPFALSGSYIQSLLDMVPTSMQTSLDQQGTSLGQQATTPATGTYSYPSQGGGDNTAFLGKMASNLIGSVGSYASGHLNPYTMSLGTTAGLAGQSDWTNPYSGIIEAAVPIVSSMLGFGAVPVLGTVLGGFLNSIIGEEPKFKPYYSTNIYNPSTRTFGPGIGKISPYGGPWQDLSTWQRIKENVWGNLLRDKFGPSSTGVFPWTIIDQYTEPFGEMGGGGWTQPAADLFKQIGLEETSDIEGGYQYPTGYAKYMNPEEIKFFNNNIQRFYNAQAQAEAAANWANMTQIGAP